MIRFGMHSSLRTSAWTREGAETAVSACARHGPEVVEIAPPEPEKVGESAGRLWKSEGR